MSLWQLTVRSLRYHWRINLAVALGVAAATAVLVGALLVGDSVRGSLRRLTLERLGRIDQVLVSDRFFRQALVEELSARPLFAKYFDTAAPAILFSHTTLEVQGESGRATGVLLVGCDQTFWSLGDTVRPARLPSDEEIALNQALADELHAHVGSEVVVRLPKGNQVPADSPLARKSDRIRGVPGLQVIDIVPNRELGRFSLRANQALPLVAYVSLRTLQDALDQDAKVNSILVSLRSEVSPEDKSADAALAQSLRPAFEDYGLSVQRITRTFPPDDGSGSGIYDYYGVTSDRMILSPEVEQVATQAFTPLGGQGVLTYLVNAIQKLSGEDNDSDEPKPIPYSMVTGIDFSPDFQLLDLRGEPIPALEEDEIVLNSWSADDQQAAPGDTLRLEYFLPETTHGQTEKAWTELIVKAITPLTDPARPFSRNRDAEFEQPATLANDPNFTPQVEGVTDQETIANWDAPFPIDYDRLRDQDDTYWENHRTTPKAFVSLATAQGLWGSRFGRLTSFRIPARDNLTADDLKAAFLAQVRDGGQPLGFSFTPVKRQQLEASRGTTPFDGLFLGLSFFIIAAALLLVALLFRLGVEQRAEELGTVLAVGLRRSRASRWLLAEGVLVSGLGGLLGVALGIAYARLMLFGLRTWWVGAITTPFLEFEWTWQSLLLGYVLGVLVCALTIAWSIRQTRHLTVRSLLSGRASRAGALVTRPRRTWNAAAISCLLLAFGLASFAVWLNGMAQAGAFLGGGAMFLAGLLLLIWTRMRGESRDRGQSLVGAWGLTKLALRNAARNPGRSVTTIGLMATASFLIVALSSFRLAPSEAGTGGFDLMAQSSEPIFGDLNSDAGREEILANDKEVLEGGLAFGFRFQPGDDASCSNLYRSSQPRVLGVTPQFVQHFDADSTSRFRWMQSSAKDEEQRRNPWRLLETPLESRAIPVVIDMNTAMYSLKPPAGLGSELSLSHNNQSAVRFQVVGLLENSVLQGSLLIGEKNFEQAFPDVSGYRYFLLQSPPGKQQELTELLEERLGDQGFDVVLTSRVLEQLFAVQNTYLSTFQSLGALGLLLGTFGLAAVQVRNVLERRGELALLRATGFRRKRIAKMVLLENVLLLLAGLLTGTIAALFAVLPHKLSGAAAIPWELLRDLGWMLLAVFVVGVLSSLLSVRAGLRQPLLAALRGK